jgi:hypothetical protein
MSGSARCRRCHAPIIFARHKDTGNSNPLDPQPSPIGNLLVALSSDSILEYEQLTKSDLEQAKQQNIPLYLTHMATCPERPANKAKKRSLVGV